MMDFSIFSITTFWFWVGFAFGVFKRKTHKITLSLPICLPQVNIKMSSFHKIDNDVNDNDS